MGGATGVGVRIIMSPTCSKRDLAGRNALSATDLTIALLRSRPPLLGRGPARRAGDAPEDYGRGETVATHNRRAREGKNPPELLIRSWKGGGRVRGMLPAPLEESAWT